MRPEFQALLGIAGVLGRGVRDEDRDWLDGLVPLDTADELAAEHERVLGRGVYAYESVFTRADGLRDEGVAVAPSYATHGLEADEPDQLGSELALYATTDDARFLRRHLGRWAAPALIAIAHQDSTVYTPLATLALELLTPSLREVDVLLPPVPDLLENPKTGLRDIAASLSVPATSGWFLSRDDIQRLADTSGLPCGFGSRRQMLETLVRTGVEHGRVEDALQVLTVEAERWDAAYRKAQSPAWRGRLARTRKMFERVAEAV